MDQFIIGTVGPAPTVLSGPGGVPKYLAPLANGTRADCVTYVTLPVLVDAENREFSYECSAVAKAYGISLSDFLAWNPGVNATSGFNYPCELPGTMQYCVQTTFDTPTDTTKNCSYHAIVEPGRQCHEFATMYNVTQAAVIAWNPSVGEKCKDFQSGEHHAIRTSVVVLRRLKLSR